MFSLKTRGIPELQDMFKEMPRHLRGVATEAASDDLVGDGNRGLRRYPSYKYVSRTSAFGKPFVSNKQRRYVMMMIRSGRIEPGYPHRTGNYQRSIHRTGSGVSSRIVGDLPHEGWPNRQAKRIGWRDWDEIASTNIVHMTQAAERAVAAWLKQKGY